MLLWTAREAVCFGRTDVDCRVIGIVVFGVEVFLYNAERFAEALEVYDFTLAQELQRIADIRVVDQAQ